MRLAGDALIADATRCLTAGTPPPVPTVVLGAGATLEAAFHAKEAVDVAVEVATYVQLAAAARSQPWRGRVLGRPPAGPPRTQGDRRLAGASAWERRAAGFGLAVLAADGLGVQHGFWVALATLAVLRSSAINTGQSAVQALLGTAGGIIAGGLLVEAAGIDTAACWILLPLAVAFMAIAPAAFSFAAGQAGLPSCWS